MRSLLLLAVIVVASISSVSIYRAKPRPWPVAEVPVAFWAWRTQAPDQIDLRAAIEKTNARSVFLRAGQIDYHEGNLLRIRPLAGTLPKGIELHLVYNATPALLKQLESVGPKALAAAFAVAYRDDLERARRDNALVRGLQLDLDVPTRLLPLYEKTLTELRATLQKDNQLSITGL